MDNQNEISHCSGHLSSLIDIVELNHEPHDEETGFAGFPFQRTSTPNLKRRSIIYDPIDEEYTKWCKNLHRPSSVSDVEGVSGHLIRNGTEKAYHKHYVNKSKWENNWVSWTKYKINIITQTLTSCARFTEIPLCFKRKR